MSSPLGPVEQECVEGYLYSRRPPAILIFRRPPARGSIWVPVSGKVEPTDDGFEAAVRREVHEETGLAHPRSVTPLDWHVPFRADNGATWRLHAYAVETVPGFVPELGPEHDRFEWLTVDDAIRRLHYPDNQEAVRRLASREIVPGNV